MKISQLLENNNIPEIMWKYFNLEDYQYTISNGVANVKVSLTLGVITPTLPIKFGECWKSVIFESAKLESLEGSPSIINSYFSCTSNNLKNLIGGPKFVKTSYFSVNNPLESLVGLPDHCTTFTCTYDENLGLLRLFQIDGLANVGIFRPNSTYAQHPSSDILNNILQKDINPQQAMLLAKRELIKHGYHGNAKL